MLNASGSKPRTRKNAALAATWLGAMSALPVGCIVGDDKCDAHQVEVKNDPVNRYCTCEANAIPSKKGFGCTPCGAHEVVTAGACVCDAGFVKLNASAECTEIVAGQVVEGSPCASDAECGGGYPHCASADASGYCTTKGCESHTDCSSPWYCDDSTETSFCHLPPSGLGMSCTTSADCAGNEASFCETLSTHVCVISGCAADPNICRSQRCCDLTALAGISLCVPESALQGGKCFDGSDPVTR